MNKHLHRIVFNAARGMRMVVQEMARSAGKATGATSGVLAVTLAGLLAVSPAPAQIVGAPGVPPNLRPTVLVAPNGVPLVNIQTPSAAGVSRNLYHQFDVQSRGVILNNSRTDVQTQLGGWVQGNPYLATGPARIILNEITSGNPTQLRGAIEVGGQRAEVIVANPAGIAVDGGTFINASRATLTTGTPQLNALGGLDGYVVRGGTVTIDGAGLDARSTDYTAILARAAQINAGLWANELKVVTGANQISVDHARATPTTGTGPAPVFALDVAQLGGMYAGKITLIGTEAGLGARNAGTIQAAGGGTLAGPGEFVVTAAGRLENIGTMQATSRGEIAAESLANSGRIASGGELRIATQGPLGNAGGILEAPSLQLASAGDLDNRGGTMRQTSGVGLTLTAPALSNTAGGVIGAEPVPEAPAQPGSGTSEPATPGTGTGTNTGTETATGGGAGSTGTTSPPSYVPAPGHIAASGAFLNDGGRIHAGGPIQLQTPQVNNSGGTITTTSLAASGPSFSNAGGTLHVTGRFSANVDRFDNTGGLLRAGSLQIASSGDLLNTDGTLASDSHASLGTGGVLNNGKGSIQAATDLSVQAGSLSNSGTLRAGNDATVNVSGALVNDGSITAGRHTTVTAGNMQGTGLLGAGVRADGQLGSTGDLRVTSSGALEAKGANLAAGSATLQGASIDLSSSTTSAANIALIATQGHVTTSGATLTTPGMLSVASNSQASQTLVNQGGKLNAAQLSLAVSNLANTAGGEIVQTGTGATTIATSGTLDNSGGRIATNAQDLTLDATAGLTNTGGKIEHAGGGTLTLTGGRYSGAGGELIGNGALAVNVTGAFDQDGGSTSAKQITIDAGSLSNQGGRIVQATTADTRISVVGALNNNAGTIASNGHTTIAAGSLSNQGGTIRAAETSNLGLAVAGLLDNSNKGEIGSGGTVTLNAGSLQNDTGRITAVGDLGATVSGTASNQSGTLAANGNTTLSAASLDNNGGSVAAVNGKLDVTTSGTTTNAGGSLQAGGAVTLRNAGLDNSAGKVFGSSVAVDAGTGALANAQGTIAATTTVDLQSGALSNDAGLIQSGAAMVINTHGQQLTNTHAAGHATGQGGITSGGTLSLTTSTLDNTAGFIGAKGAISGTTGQVSNRSAGQIIGESTVQLTTTGYDNRGGQTLAIGDLRIDAGAIDNTGALIRSAGTTTLSAGSIANATTLGPDQGIEGRNVAITTGVLINSTGAIRADANTTITSSGSIDNTSGLISAGNTLALRDPNAANPTAKTLGLVNSNGKLVANQSLQIDAATFSADGVVASGQDLRIALTQDIVNNAEVAANGNLSYITTGNFTNNGKLLAGQTLNVSGNHVENTANAEMSGLHTIVSAAGTLTNRGLIDSKGSTQVNAGTVDNIGTGRIYGDAISIGAGVLNNDAETVGGITRSASIAARESLDIGAGTINNRDRSLIFSGNSMSIGGALDGNRRATGQGSALHNLSADIESLGNMAIAMGQVNNLDTHLQVVPVTTTASTTYLATTDGKIWSYADTWGDPVTRAVYHRAGDGSVSIVGYGYADWHVDTRTVTDTAGNTDPARIVAGGNLDINGHLLNRDSHVLAGGTLTATSKDNQATQGTQTVTETLRVAYGYSANPADPAPVPLFFSTPPTSRTINVGSYRYESDPNATSGSAPGAASGPAVGGGASGTAGVSGGRGAGTIIEVPANVGAVVKTSGAAAGAVGGGAGGANGAGASSPVPMVVRTSAPNTSVPTASLFGTRPDPGGRYLVETDPRFANYRQWLSSDYLLEKLGLDADDLQKRLGDGYYEQRLIREQVAQLTGYRYLEGFYSDEEQYAALMTAGATFAKEYGLRPGIALTAEQMAQLTSDIVWLVEQTVSLPDGSTQKVLVPQVYVRVRPGDIDGSGALLSADALKIKSGGDVTNTGTLAGRTLVAINADTINNLGGRITGGSVGLEAKTDLNNIGGMIDARDSLSVKAGRDINIRTTTASTVGTAGASGTSIDRVAGLYVTNPGGTLVASAGRDVNLVGAVVANQGSGTTSIKAGHDINLGTVVTSRTTTGIADGAMMALSTRQEVGSSINAGGKLALDAGHDVHARAATVTAVGDLGVKAGNDVTIESGRSQSALAYTAQWGSGGLLSRSSNSFQAQIATDSAIGSRFSGANVNVQAGRDVNVVGSDISAADDLRVAAGRNLNIVSAVETTRADAQSSRSESGVLAPRGFRVDAARGQQQSASMSTQTERASHLSAGGNAAFTAGEQVNVYASHLSAGQTLDITGREVNVYSGINQREGSYGVQNSRSSMGLTGSMGRSGTNGLSSRASEDNRIEQTTLAPATLSGNRVNITATDGDVTLVGARINATESASLNAEQGAVSFGVVVTGTESSQARGGKDLMYQRNADSGARTESANYTQINSPNLAIKAPRVNVQVGQNVAYGSRDQAVGIPVQSLSQAIASQAGQPGMQWLTQVQNDAQLNNLQVNWQGVEVAQRQWAESQSGLTQTGAAVVTIVASALTWGYGASWSGYAANSAMGAAMNAGLSSLASQASVSLINNNGNVGAVLEDLGSSQGVRRIVTAMATAGVVQGLNMNLGMSGWTTANGASPMQVLGRNLLDGAAAAVVRTAVNGGSLETNLAEALTNGLLNTAASESAGWIGSNTTGLVNAVSHAIAGCLIGAGRSTAGGYGGSAGDGCSAGAIGAVVGEVAAGYYNPMRDPAFASETISFGQLMAGIAGALVGGSQASADIAAAAGANAVENNQFGLAGRALMAAQRICIANPALCAGAAGVALQTQLRQRATELQQQTPGLSYDRALDVASTEVISRGFVNVGLSAWSTFTSWFEATPAGNASTTPGYGAGDRPPISDNTGGQALPPAYGLSGYAAGGAPSVAVGTGGFQIPDLDTSGSITGIGYGAGSLPSYGFGLTYSVPPSIVDAGGNLPPGIGGPGTPIPMPPSTNPNQTAEDYARAAFGGQTPLSVTPIGGGWLAKLPDGTSVLYRPAGQATQTDPTTASVDINSAGIQAINNGRPAKFKFPKI